MCEKTYDGLTALEIEQAEMSGEYIPYNTLMCLANAESDQSWCWDQEDFLEEIPEGEVTN